MASSTQQAMTVNNGSVYNTSGEKTVVLSLQQLYSDAKVTQEAALMFVHILYQKPEFIS